MTRIGVTQRVEVVEEYDERRDCLDQRWVLLLQSMGYMPIPLPNEVEPVERYLTDLELDGLVFTGGNDLVHLAGATDAAPERDAFEERALEYAMEVDIPVLAVCRGLQLLNDHLGGSISKVDSHVARDHELTVETDQPFYDEGTITVNSYHGYGIEESDVAGKLEVLARAPDESIECAHHSSRPIVGIMWHPERDSPSATLDRKIFHHLFGEGHR